MTDKYIVVQQPPSSFIKDRDNGNYVCAHRRGVDIPLENIADLMNQAYLEGGRLCQEPKSSFELEEIKLKNKHLEEENVFLKERFNRFEEALDYAYRASDILKEMGHRHCRIKYGLPKKDMMHVTLEEQDGVFGKSFLIMKNDMTFGTIKDIDETIIKERIEPLLNLFYSEGIKDGKLDLD